MKEYRVNVSAINTYMRCPFRWWAQYVVNWVPIQEPEPLAFGRLLHEVFEEQARGITMEEAIEHRTSHWHSKVVEGKPFESIMAGKALSQLDDLEEALVQWKDQYDFGDTLEVEQPFEFPHPDDPSIILVGRPDRVASLDGRIWHIQNRGLNSSTNFGVYLALAKRHYHEHVYAEALAEKYRDLGLVYGGTFFNLVRKLKYRTSITKKNPLGKTKQLSEMFFQHPMTIDLDSELHKNIMECVLDQAKDMRVWESLWKNYQKIPRPNENANGGLFGNSPDEYFRVLIGEIELGDPRYFKERINPYATVEN